VKWYRKAAEQGDTNGQCSLGVMYDNGNGVAQDYAEAAKWYSKAAARGNANGQYSLGAMYLSGQVVSQDYVQASRF
jgi:TPR repeat protein